VFGQMPSSPWCVSHMGTFDVIFKKLKNPETRKVFEKWLERDQCRWQESEPIAPGLPQETRGKA
jgi:hypothetical protein